MNGWTHMNKRSVYMELETINSSPGPYTMSFGYDQSHLIQSIKKFGLINPPFVTKNRAGYMDVVMGYRRIRALNSIGWKRVPVFDLTDSKIPSQRLLLWNFHDNLATRPFNHIEKAMILTRLTSYFSHPEIHSQYLSLLGITSSWEMDFFIRLGELDVDLKEAIAHDRVSLKAVKRILEMDTESRAIVFRFMSDLNLNLNQQVQLIDYIDDMSVKEKKSIHKVLTLEPFIEILEDTSLNNPQKAKKLFTLLKNRRYPILTQTEKAFKKMIDEMNLPRQVRTAVAF